MRILTDTHTHTIMSGHAYSTLNENIVEASKKGLELIALTDHSPVVPGGPDEIYFTNSFAVPKELYGVKVLAGIEVDITDYEGKLGLADKWLKRLDFVIASMHELVIDPGTLEQNTQALIEAIKNPLVDAIGHPDRTGFVIDFEEVVLVAKKYNKLIEMNNLSLYFKKETEANTIAIAKLCKKHAVRVCLGSDAHFCARVGEFDKITEVLKSVDFPEELVISTSGEMVLDYLKERGKNL